MPPFKWLDSLRKWLTSQPAILRLLYYHHLVIYQIDLRVEGVLEKLSNSRLRNYMYKLDWKLFKMWTAIYGKPDETDVVIFNEMPRRCAGVHSDINCRKRYCETCRVLRLIMYINRARVSIDLAQLTFSHRMLFDAIVAAWNRGIRIRIVTDSQMVHVRGSVVMQLLAMGVPVHAASPRVMMHHKFCIIDAELRVVQLDNRLKTIRCRLWGRTGYVMTGSLNWTKQGTSNNYENVVITSNSSVVHFYQKIFESLWSSFEPLKTVEIDYTSYHDQLVD